MKLTTKASFLLLVALLATSLVPSIAQAATVKLTVTKSGTGAGTVTSSPAGIDCGAACTGNFTKNTNVMLTAAASSGSSFSGWSGACSGTANTCTVKMKAAKTVTASFTAAPVLLTVTKAGTGLGTVTSSPVGINCDSTCSASFNQNTSVTLTAAATAGSIFNGWTGACAGTTSTCTVAMSVAKAVTASFAPVSFPLSVTKAGTGAGTVTSSPAGISCGTTCSANFNQNSSVTLAAAATVGSAFTGWTGACTGTSATCTINLSAAQTVTATFDAIQVGLTVTKTGTGSGTISSTPAGINCGATCTSNFNQNSSVTLTATPAVGSSFGGWTGTCSGTASTCTLTLGAAQTATASFSLAKTALTVTKTGSGNGNVSSSPVGIDCGQTCSFGFAPNSAVTLTANPASGSAFQGWHGACAGTANTCSVSLSQAKTAVADFSAPATVTYQYDPNGNVTQITDPLGHNRQTQYDSLGQAVRQLEQDPTVTGSTLGQIDTDYDSLGQVVKGTDPRNLATDYQMDNLGNLLSQTSPDTGTTQNTFDEAGNLKTRTDARGKTATYSYDSQNRITQVAYDDQTITYIWDTCTNGIGRLCGLANGGNTLAFSYDLHGRVTSKAQTVGTVTQNTAYSYNAAGQLEQTVLPSGSTIGYVWLDDRLQSIAVNNQPLITQLRYGSDGQVSGWTWGNGTTSERHYDLAGRPVAISLGFDAQSLLPTLRNYSYDAAGKISGIYDDSDPMLDQTYGYDGLDRLVSNQQGAFTFNSLGYSYDLSGNRTGKVTNNSITEASTIDPGSNKLQQKTGVQTINYSYDPSGNLTSDGTLTYGYNAQGRRTSATSTTVNAVYRYNALGQRTQKTVNGSTTLFVYGEQGQLQGEYDASGQPIQETVWLGNLPIAVIKPNATQGTLTDTFYIHSDHLATPRKVTRPSDNKVLWTWDSEAFGSSLPNSNPSSLGNFTYNLRFPGQYYDAETGLNYNLNRDYDSGNGRYVESDPIGLAGGVNTYAYVGGNPVNLVDPRGLSGESQRYYLPNSPYIPGSPANKYWAKKLMEACDRMFSEANDGSAAEGDQDCNSSCQDKRLTKGEIDKLIKEGTHPHDLKDNARQDLFKDKDGNIIVKPKSGIGPGDPTGLNINDF